MPNLFAFAPDSFGHFLRRITTRAGWLAAALIIASPHSSALCADSATRPNIVFIMADDLGFGHLGCYGQEKIRTPNIDRLAAEGMRFTQVYAGNNVCAPCRSVLMTGLHMGHTPVRGNSGGIPLRDDDLTVAEVLKDAGYATGGFGKWGLGDAGSSGVAHRQGFDEFFGYYDQVHAHSYYPAYLWHNDRKHPLPGNSGRESDGLTGDERTTYSHDAIMEKARDFIRRHRDRPFFCYLPSTIPHTELLVPKDSLQEYAGRWPEPNPYVTERKHYADQPQPRAALAAMVTRLDREVGRVLDLLAELGLEENTIVFFTSDNGAQGGSGPDPRFFNATGELRGFKGEMYEGGLRVPMIVRWPGRIEPGSVSDHVWYFADVMPTLVELAGAKAPQRTDGISVVPTLTGRGEQEQHEFLYWERSAFDPRTGEIRPNSLVQAVRIGNWKAIRHRPERKPELYDLAADESETKNVAGDHSEIVARAERIMNREHANPPPQLEPATTNGWLFR